MTERELLLVQVSEECNEVAQRASKALRFGMLEIEQGQLNTNSERLLEEFNDLVAVMEMLYDKRINRLIDPIKIESKQNSKIRYMQYSKSLKVVDEEKTLDDVANDYIKQVLYQNEGNRAKTARQLNISERTLYRRIKHIEK